MKQSNKHTALYCRTTTKDDKTGGSIASQKRMLEQFAQENGCTNHMFYLDEGYSGLTFDRPAFTVMVEAIQNGRVESVLVTDLSRIGHDYLLVMRWIQDMELMGIEIIDISHPYSTVPMLTMDAVLAIALEGGEQT